MSNVFKSKARTKREQTKLFALAKDGSIDVGSHISKSKIAIDTRDEDEWTPLCWAAFNGHFDTVKTLLKANADVNVKDRQGRTPLYLSCSWGSGEDGLEIAKFLIENNADVNQLTTDNSSALYLCAFRGKARTVQLLLDAKADILQADKQDRTPIEMARSRRHKDIVDMIFEHGGKLLCEAAERGDNKLSKKLLDSQLADVNVKTEKGFTPLHYAVKRGNEALVSRLLEFNANPVDPPGVSLMELAQASGNSKLVDIFSEDETFIPYHGILHPIRTIKTKGREVFSKFTESQKEQCLSSKRLQDIITRMNIQSGKRSVFISIGCILTRNTPTTDLFRSGEWENLDKILDKLTMEKEEMESQQKAQRCRAIEEELWEDIENEREQLFKGHGDAYDEFSYRERGNVGQDPFDEFIGNRKSKFQHLFGGVVKKDDFVDSDYDSDDSLGVLIAEAEATIKKQKSQNDDVAN